MDFDNKRPPFSFREVNGTEGHYYETTFGKKVIEVIPGYIRMPATFALVQDKIQNFEVRTDDVWILAYPRTGSNWLQEMLWLIDNDVNFEEARKTGLMFRSILLEATSLVGKFYGEFSNSPDYTIKLAEKAKSPRHIKSHLLWRFLPVQLETVKPKIVCLLRDPKDTCVSLYMYLKDVFNLPFPFETFCDLFMVGKGPLGSYMDYVLTIWKMRHQSNVLFIRYEDMKKDIHGTIRRAAKFLEKNLSEDEVESLGKHLDFQEMKNNTAVNREAIYKKLNIPLTFLRKGQVGDWKNYMNDRLSAKFDTWIQQCLAGTDLTFD